VALRDAGFAVTCIVRVNEAADSAVIMDVFRAHAHSAPPLLPALAVDIGTTTVAVLLFDLADGAILASGSSGNSQIRYGADVINRIVESTRPGGMERLHDAIIDETIVPLIMELCEKANIAPSRIYRAAVACNTTMAHLFTGVHAEYIRLEPYTPAFFRAPPFNAAGLGLPLHPDAEVVLAPSVGSYVGGDISAGVLSSLLFEKEGVSLFIDLGTNGELVLGGKDYLLCCACSAGPAFEGGDISCGMRAAPGAIEACTIDAASMKPALSVIGAGQPDAGVPIGMCGSGLIDTIGELFRCGIINAKGKFIREGKRITTDAYDMTSFSLTGALEGGAGVSLTEADIDNFIRAKAAIFSGIRAMFEAGGVSANDLAHVYIAGGIGSGINVEKAIRIGMLPALPPDKFTYIGNTSLYGAYAMAASRRAAGKTDEIAAGMTYIELSNHPLYMDEFVAACFLPHTNAALFEGL
jgi:uncharacterized 2Fe-2S/4Fe-4S cluster protein (DUF4445 family)